MPVTCELEKPKYISEYIDITNILPKEKYIYGTDFIKAMNMINENLNTYNNTPKGWWNNHNNKDFVLPYKKISLFKRALVRSDIEKIKEGCIYNYGHRGEAEIKDKFYFNDDNGLFLGIYIAEGNSNLCSGTV